MKRKLYAGTTSVALPIFIQDTSSSTGAGLGSLTHATSGLVAEYRRHEQSSWTAITLVAGTLGTFTGGGFVADGSLTGAYEFCPPDAALASGVRWVAIRLRGAANMLPVLIEIELDAVDYQNATSFGLSRIDDNISNKLDATGVPGNFTTMLIDSNGNVAANVLKVNANDAVNDGAGRLEVVLASGQTVASAGTVTSALTLTGDYDAAKNAASQASVDAIANGVSVSGGALETTAQSILQVVQSHNN
jgi:hypothetical protein